MLPALSPTMELGTIVSWEKKEGDKLNEGEGLGYFLRWGDGSLRFFLKVGHSYITLFIYKTFALRRTIINR